MTALQRVRALRPADYWLLVEAWLRLALVATGLRWRGYRTIAGWVPTARTPSAGPGEIVRARRYAQSIARASRHHPARALCLARSLTLHWWLRAEGVPSELKIGVHKHGHDLSAHAWVEVCGTPIDGTPSDLAPFTPLVPVAAPRLTAAHGAGLGVAVASRQAGRSTPNHAFQDSRP